MAGRTHFNRIVRRAQGKSGFRPQRHSAAFGGNQSRESRAENLRKKTRLLPSVVQRHREGFSPGSYPASGPFSVSLGLCGSRTGFLCGSNSRAFAGIRGKMKVGLRGPALASRRRGRRERGREERLKKQGPGSRSLLPDPCGGVLLQEQPRLSPQFKHLKQAPLRTATCPQFGQVGASC